MGDKPQAGLAWPVITISLWASKGGELVQLLPTCNKYLLSSYSSQAPVLGGEGTIVNNRGLALLPSAHFQWDIATLGYGILLGTSRLSGDFIAYVPTLSLEKEPWEFQAQDSMFSTDLSQECFLHCNKLGTSAGAGGWRAGLGGSWLWRRLYCSGNGFVAEPGRTIWVQRPVRTVSKANVICLMRFLSNLRVVCFKT